MTADDVRGCYDPVLGDAMTPFYPVLRDAMTPF